MDAEIGYMEPIFTGAPLSFAVDVADAPDAADVADDADVLELVLEQAAVASATQARPVAR
jgi:hypothetical protein